MSEAPLPDSPQSIVVDGSDLAPGGMRAIEVGTHKLLLCRVDDEFFAIANRCPHVAIPLDGGRLYGSILECPLHGGKLDVCDGSPQAHPIRSPAQTYRVRPVADGLEIELGD